MRAEMNLVSLFLRVCFGFGRGDLCGAGYSGGLIGMLPASRSS